MFDLRYYQQELIEGAKRSWQSHQSVALIACTGAGKTELYMSLAVEEPGRVLVLAHRDYLLSQPIDRLKAVGFEDVGIEKADLRTEGGFDKPKVVFASVQTIGPVSQARRLEAFDPQEFSLVIVDEGHRAVASTYVRVLDHFKRNPLIRILVLTATPNRKDGIGLHNVCDDVGGTYGAARAMAEGWIVPVKFIRRDVLSLDFSNVRLKGADLDPEQVQTLLMQEKPLHEICAAIADERGPTIVFCPEVAVARAYERLMNDRYRPHSAKMLCAESSDEERQEASSKLANGDLEYIFQVNLFTEGFDLPGLLRVVWAAPTASLVRYTQGVGRVFRPHSSLRGKLVGGLEDSEMRRLLIAQSPKPFGIVMTFYPQNCKHELCDPIDILGGDDLPPDIRAYAKQIQSETSRQGGGSTTAEDIETARAVADFFAAADARLKEIKAKAVYQDTEFDPMSGRRAATRDSKATSKMDASHQWPQGEPATEKQQRWLVWKGISPEAAARFTKWRASVIRDLHDLGVSLEVALQYGKRQALKVRDEMRARKEAS